MLARRLVLLAALFAAHAFAFNPFAGSPTVGRMGEVQITVTQLRDLINAQAPEVREALRTRPELVDDLVRKELLRRALVAEAKKAEWDKRPEVALAMERAREQGLIDAYVNAQAALEPGYPAEADVAAAWEANKAKFPVPGQVRISQILLRLPENAPKAEIDRVTALARDIRIKLEKGTPFHNLALLHSQDEASNKKGGDLGWVNEDSLLPQLRSEVADLKPGEHTRPLRTRFGWQIIRLAERKPASFLPLDEVRPQLVKALRDARVQANRERFVEEIRSRSPATLDEKRLKEVLTP